MGYSLLNGDIDDLEASKLYKFIYAQNKNVLHEQIKQLVVTRSTSLNLNMNELSLRDESLENTLQKLASLSLLSIVLHFVNHSTLLSNHHRR